MRRRIVILNVKSLTDKGNESRIHSVTHNNWVWLTAYLSGVMPSDTDVMTQLDRIADELGLKNKPIMPHDREHIAAHWIYRHSPLEDVPHWDCHVS